MAITGSAASPLAQAAEIVVATAVPPLPDELQGMIVPGKSRRMPTPLPLPVEAQAGAETVTRALRQAEADPQIAAVILHIESPGGSSLASDLIWREVRRLRERKPVVVLMGSTRFPAPRSCLANKGRELNDLP